MTIRITIFLYVYGDECLNIHLFKYLYLHSSIHKNI